MKGRLSNLRDVVKAEGFEIYTAKKEVILDLLRLGSYEPLVGLSAIRIEVLPRIS
jgi:hypothetical protein